MAAKVIVGVETYKRSPVNDAAQRLPDCVSKNTAEFAVAKVNPIPTDGIMHWEAVRAILSEVANRTADNKIVQRGSFAISKTANADAPTNRTASAAAYSTRRSYRSAIHPATGLATNSAMLTIAKKAATAGLPCPDTTSIQAEAI
jgi:hypothetical protein